MYLLRDEKYIAIPLKPNYDLQKIISYDEDYRLLLVFINGILRITETRNHLK